MSRYHSLMLLLLYVILILAMTVLVCAEAETQESKSVRVAWFESPFSEMDQFGRRSGYAYEYQQRIAAYTGWTYEYVEGTFEELLHLLETGDIDLMSDVSYTEERAGVMRYSELPMGEEDYYAYIRADNTEITPVDYASFNGKRIGVSKGTIQEQYLTAWAESNSITFELVEQTCQEDESLRALMDGRLDVFVTIGTGGTEERVPVCKIGSSQFYFAVNRNRPDLFEELNAAMKRISEENSSYNKLMFDSYAGTEGISAFLTYGETDWLAEHGTIRVGYRDDYLSFCDQDEDTGELTGALRDYLTMASTCIRNAPLTFETVAYPSTEAALEALDKGEVDCVFPVSLKSYDGEMRGILLTETAMRAEMYAVVRTEHYAGISPEKNVVVAVNTDNLNYDTFLRDVFPKWTVVYYEEPLESIRAVASGRADCVLVNTYRLRNIVELCETYRLSTVPTGKSMRMSFAIRKADRTLYAVMNRVVGLIPEYAVNSALTYYSIADEKTTLREFVRANLMYIAAFVAAVVSVILFLLFWNLRTEKKLNEGKQLILAVEYDRMTMLYTKEFFFEYVNRLYREHPERQFDALALDIEQFHSVNALNGREFGDHVLIRLGEEIRAFLSKTEGAAGRIEGDRFNILCSPQADYPALLARLQGKLDELSRNVSIRLRMGVMPWQEGVDPVTLFDRAWSACNMVRGGYKTRLMVYNEEMRRHENLNQRLLNDLRQALEEQQFRVYYQPKYDIQCDPPRLTSAEALIRWQHPELGLIAPDEFIPLFENNGQIGALDRYVWEEVGRQIARWRDEYGVIFPVSVNLSRVDVFDPSLENILEEIVRDNRIDRDMIMLEVTESAYTENADQLIHVINHLRDAGYKVEMDDFGSGYSSLNMLSSMPIDVLKMDRLFIRNIENSDRDMRLVELILEIARNLRVVVVAEGVETKDQLSLLRDAGCALVQGYYFSRPLPAETFTQLIIQQTANRQS